MKVDLRIQKKIKFEAEEDMLYALKFIAGQSFLYNRIQEADKRHSELKKPTNKEFTTWPVKILNIRAHYLNIYNS